jgi:Tfp pilus assembly protein PilE
MKIKYIIMVILCILVGVGYNIYRNRSIEKEMLTRNEKEYSRIAEIANKSPKAGLSEMGRSLEKYYAENQKYPPTLSDLYPKYLANKSLIDEVEWNYAPGKDNFLLTKAVTVSGQKMTASTDKTLRPMSGETILVATKKEGSASARQQFAVPGVSDLVAKLDSVALKEEKIMQVRLIDPEFALIRETEIKQGFENEISRKVLVWKDDKGVTGFGNIQYPRVSKLTIYNEGRRYDLQRSSYGMQKYSESYNESLTFKRDLDAVAASQSREHLVWKNRNGTLGFGNLQYPENKDVVYINVGGTWQKAGS